MTKAFCPTDCGKKFISLEHARSHADIAHPDWMDEPQRKQKGWATPCGFVDFEEPVTYEHAHSFMQNNSAEFVKLLFANKNTTGEQS